MTAAWSNSNRRAELPPNWSSIRRRILDRDGHRCTWTEHGHRCTETTRLEVDHAGDPNDHTDDNLRTLCHPHHSRHTAAQSAAGRTPTRRPPERHPGLR